MNIIYFGYSWWEEFKLDPYQQSIVDTLMEQGHHVHVIIGNRFAESDGLFGFSASPDLIAEYIQENDIKLAICKNNSGNYSEIRNRVEIPFVSWASDEFNHIFRPDGGGPAGLSKFFGDNMYFLTTSSDCDRFYRRTFPEHQDRIHFISHCTSPQKFREAIRPQTIDVSFVGSSLDMGHIYRLLLHYSRPTSEAGQVYRAILEAVESLKVDYSHDFEGTLDRLNLRPVLELHGLSVSRFKVLCSNVTSNNERFQFLSALREFNLAIFGNQAWIDSLSFTTNLCQAYRPWNPVENFADLVEVYQSSKISISIPQLQVGAAIQYRVIDIMASNALLFTKYSDDSDLYRIFGDDCPVPMYKSAAHLRELCEYYLKNELERKALVVRCQELVRTKFSFEYRLSEIFKMVGLPFELATAGKVIKPDINIFYKKTPLWLRYLIKASHILPPGFRNRLKLLIKQKLKRE